MQHLITHIHPHSISSPPYFTFLIYLLGLSPQRFMNWQVQFSMWAVSSANHVMTTHALPHAKASILSPSHTHIHIDTRVADQSVSEGVAWWLPKKCREALSAAWDWRECSSVCVLPYVCHVSFSVCIAYSGIGGYGGARYSHSMVRWVSWKILHILCIYLHFKPVN